MLISLTLPKVDAYFARFHFLLPVIDKPFFLRKFANIMDNSHNLDIVRSETAFLSLLFAVFACAANLVQDTRLSTSERHDDGGMGMVYYERYVVVYIAEPTHLTWFSGLSSCNISVIPALKLLMFSASF